MDQPLTSPTTQNRKYLLIVPVALIALIVVILGILVFKHKITIPQLSSNASQPQVVGRPAQPVRDFTVDVTAQGFSPQSLTVPVGSRVLWLNQTNQDVSVNSDDYPSNKKYPQLNLGKFGPNFSVQLIFNQIGTYTYHNQLIPSQAGTIVVTK